MANLAKYSLLGHLKNGLEAAKAYALSKVNEHTVAVVAALKEMEAAKADKYSATTATISTSGWVNNTSVAAYPYYYDISVSGVTTNDRADIVIAQTSLATAKACGLCATSETLAGKIRIRAAKTPTTSISVQYTVVKGKET